MGKPTQAAKIRAELKALRGENPAMICGINAVIRTVESLANRPDLPVEAQAFWKRRLKIMSAVYK